MPALIHQFFCRSDNYGVLIRDQATGATAAIDAPEAAAIEKALADTGWKLTDIFVTHRHIDHIEGIPALVARHGCRVTAPEKARAEVPGAQTYVSEGDRVTLGTLAAKVWDTPGHCRDHIAYYFPDDKILFAGDTLFAIGCGRVSESSYEDMWSSLERMAALPDDTTVYCGHEYTLSNAKFALHVDPGNAALRKRAAEVEVLRARGAPTLPTTIGLEKTTNPFLRAGNAARFAELREAKNKF